MQHIEFPQDVNSGEPRDEVEAFILHGLTSAKDGLSKKQAHWLIGAARVCEWEPEGVAYALAVIDRAGPNMEPFEASDEQLEAEARRIFDHGIAGLLRHAGRLQ